MSKAALNSLIDRLETSIREDVNKRGDEKAAKVFRRTDTNRYANAFRIRKKDFKKQVTEQIKLSKTAGVLGTGDTIAVWQLCDKYYEKIAWTLITRAKQNPKLELVIGQDEVTIISWERRELTNFDAITQQTLGSKAILRKTVLQPFLEELNELLARRKKGHLSDSFTNEFNLGHQEGSNIQYFVASQLQQSLDETIGADETIRERVLLDIQEALNTTSQRATDVNERSVVIEASSKFHNRKLTDLNKVILLGIESRIANQNKDEDRGVREELTAALRRFVNNRPVTEWVEQESSDSIVRGVAKVLVQEAVKQGGKTVKVSDKSLLKAINTTPGKARKSRKNRDKDIVTVANFGVNITPARGATAPLATPSYISIIMMLNARLPPRVRANMGSPRLNNRTGRLSESARVTNIVTTPGGHPSIEYTYQRSPYDVFDKTLGKKPWNTPMRDPSDLISMSVRQLAYELGMRRFYTRRAS